MASVSWPTFTGVVLPATVAVTMPVWPMVTAVVFCGIRMLGVTRLPSSVTSWPLALVLKAPARVYETLPLASVTWNQPRPVSARSNWLPVWVSEPWISRLRIAATLTPRPRFAPSGTAPWLPRLATPCRRCVS